MIQHFIATEYGESHIEISSKLGRSKKQKQCYEMQYRGNKYLSRM